MCDPNLHRMLEHGLSTGIVASEVKVDMVGQVHNGGAVGDGLVDVDQLDSVTFLAGDQPVCCLCLHVSGIAFLPIRTVQAEDNTIVKNLLHFPQALVEAFVAT